MPLEKGKVNYLLRNGRIVNEEMRNSDVATKLEKEYNFLEFVEKDFFKCVHEDDDDFDIISEDQRVCDAEIEIKPEKVKYQCPQCQRIIYLEDKNYRFKKYQVKIIEKTIKNFVKNSFKNSGFKYLRPYNLTFGQQKFPLYKFTYDLLEFEVAIIDEIPDGTLLDWIEIYSYPIIFVLFDSAAVSAQNTLKGRTFRFTDIGNLLTADTQIRTNELLDLAKKCTIETKAKFWGSLPKVIDKLENKGIDYYSYEQCVYVLLKSIIDSTDKFGNSHLCKTLPDGYFTISPPKGKEYGSYIYDCKFTTKERKLASSDYRAVYDYIRSFRTSSVVTGSNFRDIDGFIIFSHNLPLKELEKTFSHIRSRSRRDDKDPWNGKLIYFETDSLVLLTKLLMEKRDEIERRKVFFFDYLNLFLNNEDLHQNTAIEKKGIIHISKSDIESMVEFVLSKDPDEERIDADALIEDLRKRDLL